MAQRDNMPEGTDSIIEGASGASSGGTTPSNNDFGSGGYGSAGTGGTGMTGGASGAGLSSGATGAAGGANSGSSLGGDYGSSSGTSSTTAFGSSASTGADAAVGSGATALPNASGSGGGGGLSGGVQNLKSQATDKARQAAMQGKDRATDALGNVSTLVRDAGGMIDERLGQQYGEYARKAAGAIDNFSEQLRGKEVDELFDDAKNLVRKSPGVAIGIAATVGFVLVRALKAGTDAGSTTKSTGSTGYAANDGATPPLVSDRGGVA